MSLKPGTDSLLERLLRVARRLEMTLNTPGNAQDWLVGFSAMLALWVSRGVPASSPETQSQVVAFIDKVLDEMIEPEVERLRAVQKN